MLDLSFLSREILLEGWSFRHREERVSVHVLSISRMMILLLFPILHDLDETDAKSFVTLDGTTV